MDLNSEVKYLTGIGEKRARLLEKELEIRTVSDLLHFFPFRYVDRSKVYSISEICDTASYVQLRGVITSTKIVGEGKSARLVAYLHDSSGHIELVFFKGIKWMSGRLVTGKEYIVFGRVNAYGDKYNMVHPEVEPAGEAATQVTGASMMGIYPSTEKLKSANITNKVIGKLQHNLLSSLPSIPETLPREICRTAGLMPLDEALRQIHFPRSQNELKAARFRLKWEELFFLQLGILRQRNVRTKGSSGLVFSRVGEAFNWCYTHLKFELTGAQKKVIRQIRDDCRSGRQMNRLLQGDVGSGKTMVALLTALIAVDNGYQACIMAPTEVLARQHFNSVSRMMEGSGVRVAILTGSSKTAERREALEGIVSEDPAKKIDILIGTHALIEDTVQFSRLGYVVIDEQHRFGVDQRARLRLKSATLPHILVMTATPIPRTLAMTLYGDLDVSVLDEMPPGRVPVKTVHLGENRREQLYAFMEKQIAAGRQVFIVYPLIQESETLDYKNLQEGYEHIIQRFPAPKYITAVVHGQQSNENKQYDMDLFASGRAHILVATSVIEVGVDVPNATVMVIESAERFGLSQLHQLRGRVGRGGGQSYCVLMSGYKLSKESRRRIEMMCAPTDGLELAEEDLRMRGPGDMEGTRQSGMAIDLHIANLSTDGEILTSARHAALGLLEADPLLSKPENRPLREHLNALKQQFIDYSTIS